MCDFKTMQSQLIITILTRSSFWPLLGLTAVDYQSINQISIALISPAKPVSVARQPNQCSTAKPRKQLCNINRSSGMLVSMGERPNQRDLSSDVERSHWNGWTDRQREVVAKRWGTRVNSPCACVGIDPRDWQTYRCLISLNGMEVMRQVWSEDKQTFSHRVL